MESIRCQKKCDERIIDKAHAKGIICNVFWADEPDEARKYFEMA